ncbi:cobalamin biosynthesis protein CbiG [Clostridium acetireducens DSM 10703]|uniref:Cobalamin biosynthesis protein CbiG n=1 Tax=Clostridium acetireducens DSM 10703 TaxID=1121290 RepID=A0A1E8EZZ1_9CLOT|nr:cobalt-precorrin 5A hydrolase [Clostridium acetireducens]OFI06707.1 cobalamin biosynthesis protein CbiG [Clostridium acetireducens DSM 10703]
MKIAVISVTNRGDALAEKLKEIYEVDFYSKNILENFNIYSVAGKSMKNYKTIVFISSTGIAVRAISGFIKSKAKDPAVIVIDSSGKFVISLLSGHLGGANEETLKIAKHLKSIPVITTATDNIGIKAPDIIAKENNLVIDNFKAAKDIAALLVAGEKVAFKDFRGIIEIPKGYIENQKEAKGIVYVTNELNNLEGMKALKLIRKDIVIGIGCRKNYDSETMKNNVLKILEQYNIDKRAIKNIATVEIKKHEKAILDLVKYLNCDLKIFTIEEIKNIQDKFQGSAFVEKTIGVKGVCEPVVELSGGKLITDKIKVQGMTIALGII